MNSAMAGKSTGWATLPNPKMIVRLLVKQLGIAQARVPCGQRWVMILAIPILVAYRCSTQSS